MNTVTIFFTEPWKNNDSCVTFFSESHQCHLFQVWENGSRSTDLTSELWANNHQPHKVEPITLFIDCTTNCNRCIPLKIRSMRTFFSKNDCLFFCQGQNFYKKQRNYFYNTGKIFNNSWTTLQSIKKIIIRGCEIDINTLFKKEVKYLIKGCKILISG